MAGTPREHEELASGLEQLTDEKARLQEERSLLLRATVELEQFRRAALEALYIRERDKPSPEPTLAANVSEPAHEDGYRSQSVGLRVRVAAEESDVTKLNDEVLKLRELLAAMKEEKRRRARGPRTFLWTSVATLVAGAVGAAADAYFGSIRWSIAAPALVFPFTYVLLLSGILPAQPEGDRSNNSRYPGGQ